MNLVNLHHVRYLNCPSINKLNSILPVSRHYFIILQMLYILYPTFLENILLNHCLYAHKHVKQACTNTYTNLVLTQCLSSSFYCNSICWNYKQGKGRNKKEEEDKSRLDPNPLYTIENNQDPWFWIQFIFLSQSLWSMMWSDPLRQSLNSHKICILKL